MKNVLEAQELRLCLNVMETELHCAQSQGSEGRVFQWVGECSREERAVASLAAETLPPATYISVRGHLSRIMVVHLWASQAFSLFFLPLINTRLYTILAVLSSLRWLKLWW
jgi:hypothetical protein